MTTKTHFPFFRWTVSKLTGRWARRIYIAVILIPLCLATAARLRSYFMARRIQAVLHSLAEVRIDQTTEEELLKKVPYLVRNEHERKVEGVVQRWYYVEITNESDRLMKPLMSCAPRWVGLAAYWLGYRYMRFDARILVLDGKVTKVGYGLAARWSGPMNYFVSAESFHGIWHPRQYPFTVWSEEDQSPQYRARGDDFGLYVAFTNDAPPERIRRAFQLNLSCFWSLRGCGNPPRYFNCPETYNGCGGTRQIAPGMWQDAQAIEKATRERLQAGSCPDSIIESRMRYLPDVAVLRLEVTGSRQVKVNEEGNKAADWFTDYKLKEVIRGGITRSWKNIFTIPSAVGSTETITSQHWPNAKIGSEVLFFENMNFESCQFIPVSSSALAMARQIPVPPKRSEDQIGRSLQ